MKTQELKFISIILQIVGIVGFIANMFISKNEAQVDIVTSNNQLVLLFTTLALACFSGILFTLYRIVLSPYARKILLLVVMGSLFYLLIFLLTFFMKPELFLLITSAPFLNYYFVFALLMILGNSIYPRPAKKHLKD